MPVEIRQQLEATSTDNTENQGMGVLVGVSINSLGGRETIIGELEETMGRLYSNFLSRGGNLVQWVRFGFRQISGCVEKYQKYCKTYYKI